MVLLLFQHTHLSILNVEPYYLSWVRFVPECCPLPCIAQAAFQLWSQPEVHLLASSHTNQFQHYHILEKPPHLGTFGVTTFNHPWTYQVSYVSPSPAIVPLVLSNFLAEQVTGHFRLTLVAPCLVEVPLLSRILNMLENIPHWCPILNNPIMDVLQMRCSRVCCHCI